MSNNDDERSQEQEFKLLSEYCGQDVFPSAAVCFWGEDFRRLSTTGPFQELFIQMAMKQLRNQLCFHTSTALKKTQNQART